MANTAHTDRPRHGSKARRRALRRRRLWAAGGAVALTLTVGVPVGVFTAEDAAAYRDSQDIWSDASSNNDGIRQMYDYDNGDSLRMLIQRNAGDGNQATKAGPLEVTFASERSGEVDTVGPGYLNNTTTGNSSTANVNPSSSMYNPQISTTQRAAILRHVANGISTSTAGGTTNYRPYGLEVRFNYAVTNPTFHFAGLGGTLASGTTWASTFATHQIDQQFSPGVVWGATTNNLTTDSGGTRLRHTAPDTKIINPQCDNGYAYVANMGSVAAGCGSALLLGDSLFNVFMDVAVTKSSNSTGPSASAPGSDQYNLTITLPEDQGDAPASYDNTTLGAASHTLGGVRIGAVVDEDSSTSSDPMTNPNAVVAGATNTGVAGDGADEDAFGAAGPPPMPPAAGTYRVTVPLSKTVDPGDVCAWIDFNRNGLFDGNSITTNTAGEMSCTTYNVGATSVTLTWNKPATTANTNYYMRIRAVGSFYDYYNTNAAMYVGPAASCAQSPCVAGDRPIIMAVPQRQSNIVTPGNVGAVAQVAALGDGPVPISPLAANSGTFDPTGQTYTGEVEDWQVLSAAADDYGDAPASYGTAQHTAITPDTLRIGATEDSESAANTSADASGDDATGTDDEDGFPSPLPSLSDKATTYSLTVPVTNTTGSAATLAGWIDLNRNGVFDGNERATVSVPNGATTATLTWTLTGTAVAGPSFARLRLMPGTVAAPDAAASIAGGEAEDYPLTITPTPGLALAKTSRLTTDKDGDARADAGDVITYSFLVTNTGTAQLTNVTVTDPKIPASSMICPSTTLAAGASMTCTATYTVTQADVDQAQPSATSTLPVIVNTATAAGTPPGTTTPITTPPSSTETPTDRTRGIAIDKTVKDTTTPPVAPATTPSATPDGYASLGETLNYTFVVTNTGTTTLSNIRVSDPKLDPNGPGVAPDITCVQPVGGLAPGASTTCTAAYVATATDVGQPTLLNTAQAIGTGPQGTDTTSTPDNAAIPTLRTAGITLAKTARLNEANGVVGDDLAEAGDTITYSFLVTNTGDTQLTGVTVNDPKLAAAGVQITCPVTTLAAKASTTCTGTYTVTQADVTAGSVNNSATATGTPPTGVTPPTSPPSDTSIRTNDRPGLSIVKNGTLRDQDGDGYGDVGEVVNYTFLVTNTGTVALSNVNVTDTKVPGPITCPVTTLAPGASTTCTASYTITQADMDASSIINVATAHGTPPNTTTPIDSPPDSHVFQPMDDVPNLTLDKTGTYNVDADSDGKADVGDTINYTFRVTNTGNVTLDPIRIEDSRFDPATIICTATRLSPGQSTTCYAAMYYVNQTDVNSGQVVNTATAFGQPPTPQPTPDRPNPTPPAQVPSNPDTVTFPTDTTAAMTLDKSHGTPTDANGDGRIAAGDTVVYTFLVTNTGNVPVNGVKINDPKVTSAGATITCRPATIAPDDDPATTGVREDQTTCTSTPYTITQADADAYAVNNVAIANGIDTNNDPVVSNEDPDRLPLAPVNSLTIDKQSTLANTNASSAPDTRDIDGDGNTTELVPTADAGEVITYRFVVTNTGTQTISNLVVDDDMLLNLDPPITPVCPSAPLAPGATATCSARYTVTQADVLAGVVANEAFAEGTPPDPTPLDPNDTPPDPVTSPPDGTETPTNQLARLTLDKQSALAGTVADANSNGLADVGETISYTFVVRNTGTVPVSEVTVTDPKVTNLACPPATLLPADDSATTNDDTTMTCTASSVVRQADVDAGAVVNTATASGTPPPGVTPPVPPTDTTTTPTDSAPALKLVKTGRLTTDTGIIGQARPGDVITYTFALTNVGKVTLTNPQVTDNRVATVTCPTGPIAVGATVNCTATYTVTQADINAQEVRNTATSTAVPPDPDPNDGVPPTPVPSNPSTSVTPVEYVKSMRLEKVASVETQVRGGLVDYTFTVTNTGTTILQNVTISDPKIASAVPAVTITCNEPAGGLLPGQEMTCTAIGYTVSQGDADAGVVRNTATATATTPNPDDEPVISNPATDIVTVPTNPALTLLKIHGPGSDADGDGFAEVGESINYQFQITNTGDVTLTNLSVTDQMLASAGDAITCPTAPLAPGATATCTAVYDVMQADVNAGSVNNTATAYGVPPTPPSGITPPPVPSDPSDTTVPTLSSPAASLEKAAQLLDRDGDARADVGESIRFTFTVTNTGSVTLTDIAVADDLRMDGIADDPELVVTCPATPLVPGAQAVCTATRVVTQADVDSTSYALVDLDKDGVRETSLPSITNVAVASGLDPQSQTVMTNEDDTATPIDNTASATLTKTGIVVDATTATPPGDGDGEPDVGETVSYSFIVKNTGKLTLTNPVVNDQMLADAGVTVTCPQDVPVAPGGTIACTATYTVRQADVDARQIHNLATVDLTDPNGRTVTTPPDEVTLVPGYNPAITMTKDGVLDATPGDGDGLADAGETITYTFTVANTGNVTLSPVTVADPRLTAAGVPVTCPADDPATADVDEGALAPGATTTCTSGPYTVTQADVDAGPIANRATATGTPPPDPSTPDLPPTPVTSPPGDDVVPVDDTARLQLDKAANLANTVNDADGDGLADVGENIVFTFLVTNTGGVTESNLRIFDAMLSALNPPVTPVCPVSVLAPGASTTCTATSTVTQADVDAGQITNVATAIGTPPNPAYDPPPYDPDGPDGPLPPMDPLPGQDPDGPGPAQPGEVPSNPDDTVTPADQTPGLFIDKTARLTTDPDGDGKGDLDDVITFTVTTINTGAITLTDVAATDQMLTDAGITLTCQAGTKTPADPTGTAAPCTTLLPGQSVQWTATYTVTQADVDAGKVVNVATAQGTPPGQPPVPATPPDPTPEDPTDPPPLPGDPVRTETPTDNTPSIALVKTGTLNDVREAGFANGGETIQYTFTVTNTGPVDLTGVVVNDDMLAAEGDPISCPKTTLAIGESMTCTATHVVTNQDLEQYADAGLIRNVATSTGTPPDPDPSDGVPPTPVTSPPDDVEIPMTSTSGMTVVKHGTLDDTDGDGLADAGEEISYTFTVTNTGEVPILDVSVNDTKMAEQGIAIHCPADSGQTVYPGPLEPFTTASDFVTGSNIVTCASATPYVVTQADVDSGQVLNFATATGTPTPPGEPVTTPPSQDTTPTDQRPAIGIDKIAALDERSGVTDDAKAEAGDTIDYSFLVTNTGTTTLTNVGVDDPKLTGPAPDGMGLTITCDPLPAEGLTPGGEVTCHADASYTVTIADVDSGVIHNVATSHGTPVDPPPYDPDGPDGPLPAIDPAPVDPDGPGPLLPGDPVTSPPDPADVPTNIASAMTLEKSSAITTDDGAAGLADVGDVITYTFRLTNTGTTTLTGITVNDPMLAAATNELGTLGITPTCDAATKNPPDDPGSGLVPCETLVPGQYVDFTATYTVTQADVNAGAVDNQATATGKGPDPDGPGPQVPPTVPADPDDSHQPVDDTPELTLVKSVTDSTGENPQVAELGEVVRYSFLVTNTGAVSMSALRIDDPMLAAAGVAVTCPLVQLEPGQSVTCTATAYTTTTADVLGGSVRNVATAYGVPPTPPGGTTPAEVPSGPSETTIPTISHPGLAFQKTAMLVDPATMTGPQPAAPPTTTWAPNPAYVPIDIGVGDQDGDGLGDVGDQIAYVFQVVNTGDVPIGDVTITDPTLAAIPLAINCPVLTDDPATQDVDESNLQPGQSLICYSDPYEVTEADAIAGEATNTATVTGTPPDPNTPIPPVTPSTTITPTDADPGIDLVKTAVVNDADGTLDAGDLDKDGNTSELAANVGETITYSFLVTNTGYADLTGVRVIDDMINDTTRPAGFGDLEPTCTGATKYAAGGTAAPVQAPCDTLQPGEYITFTVTYPVAQSDVNTGTIRNAAVAAGIPEGATTDDPDGDGPLEAGEIASNTRTAIVPTDTRPEIGLVKSSTLVQSGTPNYQDSDGDGVYDVDTDDLDNDGNVTEQIGLADVGERIDYTFTITNTGTVPIVDVTITDAMLRDAGAPVTCQGTQSSTGMWTLATPIPIDGTTTCTASYTVQQADVDAGVVVNSATARGRGPDPDGPGGNPPPESPETPPSVPQTPTNNQPGMTLDKRSVLTETMGVTTDGLAEAGDTVAYTFVITNTGSTTLTGLSVSDPTLAARGITVSCPALPLPPGAATTPSTMTCTASGPYTVTAQDVINGFVPNTATATGVPPDPTPDDPSDNPPPLTTPPDTTVVVTNKNPQLEMAKTSDLANDNSNYRGANGLPTTDLTMAALDTADLDGDGNTTEPIGLADVGEVITYTFHVTNTGTVPMENVTINDPMFTGAAAPVCPSGTLLPGRSVDCTAQYTVTQDDVDTGRVLNSATAQGTLPPPTDPDGPGPLEPGDPYDPDGPEGPQPPIDPTDPDGPGPLEPPAPGEPPTPVVTPPDTTETPANDTPALALAKTSSLDDTDRDGLGDVGETLTYTLVVTNTGTVTLTDPTVSDPKLASQGVTVTCPAGPVEPGESVTCTLSGGTGGITDGRYTITQADVDAGSVYNVATPSATPPPTPDKPTPPPVPGDPGVTNDPVDRTPSLSLVKSSELRQVDPANYRDADGDGINDPDVDDLDGDGDTTEPIGLAAAGDTIVYTFTVENTGEVTMSNLTIADAKLAGVTPAPVAVTCRAPTLAPGATTTCTSAPYTVTQADVDAGYVANYAVALGTPATPADPDGPGPLRPPAPYDPPEYDPDGPGPLPPVDPAPGDPVPSGPGETLTPGDPAPALEIVKESALNEAAGTEQDGNAAIGDTVDYTFTVTNTGTMTMRAVTVSDDLLAGMNITPVCQAATKTPADPAGSSAPCTTLVPGQSVEFTARYTVSATDIAAGSVHNVAIAEGTPPPVDPDGPGPFPPVPIDPDGPGPRQPGDPVPSPPDDTVTPTEQAPAFMMVKSATLNDEATDDDLAQLGETITFTFTVTNTGDVPLHDTAIDDPLLEAAGVTIGCPGDDPDTDDGDPATTIDDESVLQPFDDPATTIRTENEMVCVSTPYTVTQRDVDSGRVYNVAAATATPPPDPEAPGTPPTPIWTPPDHTDTPADRQPALTLDKQATLAEANGDTSDGKAAAGDTIAFTFTVTNTGNTTMENVTVNDPKFTGTTAPVCDPASKVPADPAPTPPAAAAPCTTLVPGQLVVFRATYTVSTADVGAGQVFNVATAQGELPPPYTPPMPYDPDPNDDVPPFSPPPAPPYDPDGPGPLPPGSPVPAPPDGTTTPTELKPGLTMVKAASLANTNGSTGPDVLDSDGDGDVTELVPLADAGEKITFTFTVTNTGNARLTSVRIADPMLTAAGVTTSCTPTALDPGGVATCTSTPYTVTQADVDAGKVYNLATAAGTLPPPVDPPPYDPDGPGPLLPVDYPPLPYDPPPYDPDGPDGPLPPVDPPPGGDPDGPGPLQPGDVPSPPDDTITPSNQAPALTLEKNATLNDEVIEDDLAQEGETITFTFLVRNTGTTTLTGVRVQDAMLEAAGVTITCAPDTLAPGASVTCTATPYRVAADDIATGYVYNQATALGTPPTPGEPVESPPGDTVTPGDRNPAFMLDKGFTLADDDGDGLADLGETIVFSYTLANTGAVELEDVSVTDPMLAAATPPVAITCPSTTLALDTTMVCTSAPYAVTQRDVDSGRVFNVAAATGTPPPLDPDGPDGNPPIDQPPVSTPPDDVEVPADRTPSWTLDKAATLTEKGEPRGDGKAVVGDTIAFTFTVTNTGSTTMRNVAVDDPMLAAAGLKVACTPATLVPGAKATCTTDKPYTVTQADVDAGQVFNVATASGTVPPPYDPPPLDPDGPGPRPPYDPPPPPPYDPPPYDPDGPGPLPPVDPRPGDRIPTPPDGTSTPTEPRPELTLVKTATLHDLNGNKDVDDVDGDGNKDEFLADAGETIDFTFVVTNTGTATMKDITVDDPSLAALTPPVKATCPAGALTPGASTTCTATYAVTHTDAAKGFVYNFATALGAPPTPVDPPPFDPDGPGPLPPVDPPPAAPFDPPPYDPDGPGPLPPIDPRPGDPVPSGPGITYTPSDPAPRLSLVKHATLVEQGGDTTDGLAEEGDTIEYAFTVTNTGSKALRSVTVDDPMLTAAGIKVTCPATTEQAPLLAGTSIECTSTVYTVTAADVKAGKVHNVATPTGIVPADPDGPGPLPPYDPQNPGPYDPDGPGPLAPADPSDPDGPGPRVPGDPVPGDPGEHETATAPEPGPATPTPTPLAAPAAGYIPPRDAMPRTGAVIGGTIAAAIGLIALGALGVRSRTLAAKRREGRNL